MIRKEDIDVTILLEGDNKLIIRCNELDGCNYAYYVYKDNQCIDKIGYSENPESVYWLTLSGKYRVSAFVKPQDGNRVRKESNEIDFVPPAMPEVSVPNGQEGILHNAYMVAKEIRDNLVMSFRIAQYDYQLENKGTYLGKIWSLLTPLIQIGIYWFVFGIGLRRGRDVDGYPFIVWMLCGLIPWFCLNGGFLQGANSVVRKANNLSRMKYPLATVPVSAIFVVSFEHVMMLVVMIFMLFCKGVYPKLGWINTIYYIVYMFVFLVSLSLVTSVLTVITRDFYKLLQSLMRLLFYITPILWTMNDMPQLYQKVMEYNPVYYVVKGFRESILYNTPFWTHYDKLIVFWGINILLFLLGANLQMKFKHKFIDLI